MAEEITKHLSFIAPEMSGCAPITAPEVSTPKMSMCPPITAEWAEQQRIWHEENPITPEMAENIRKLGLELIPLQEWEKVDEPVEEPVEVARPKMSMCQKENYTAEMSEKNRIAGLELLPEQESEQDEMPEEKIVD